MAVSGPPKRNKETIISKVDEKVINDIINNGGKTLSETITPKRKQKEKTDKVQLSKNRTNGLKGITLLLTLEEAEIIDKLRQSRIAPRGKKIAISFHNWIIEAVQDKIEKESIKTSI